MESIKDYTEKLKNELKNIFLEYNSKDKQIFKLFVLQVGNDPAAAALATDKIKEGKELGIKVLFKKINKITEDKLISYIRRINKKKKIDGLSIQFPLPDNISEDAVKAAISPDKDVEGMNPNSEIYDCYASGTIKYLKDQSFAFNGKNVLLIGAGDALEDEFIDLLLYEKSTLAIAHSYTPVIELKKFIEISDLIITEVKKPNTLTANMKFKESSIVIDESLNKLDNGILLGDCEKNLSVEFQSEMPNGMDILVKTIMFKNLLGIVEKKYSLLEVKDDKEK